MTVAEVFEKMTYGPAPESAAPAHEWLEAHDRRFGCLIGGRWAEAGDGRTMEVHNPATGERLASISLAGRAEVDAAVAAARAALPGWSGLSGHARARHLYALARQVQKHARLLAVLETLDNGKPIRETRDLDVPLVARHFYHHAGWAQLRDEEFPGKRPVGVVGQIIPWNFPLLMLAWKVAPALAAGCTVVLKPSEVTPLSAFVLAEVMEEAGVPPGVFNLVTGFGPVVGEALAGHEDVDMVSFTGSTRAGRRVSEVAARTVKKVALELGGKSPNVILDDADLERAVVDGIKKCFINSGQTCSALTRMLSRGTSMRVSAEHVCPELM
ncbi:MAG TPA: aldehyde dehydrogenase family protein, partial [Deinococcales bacterium]|nr:aldehyde dehydrogenase family protein [Deinococcales bacterium]